MAVPRPGDYDELARSYCQSRLGLEQIRLISASNNHVYAVGAHSHPAYALKILLDTDIDMDIWELVRGHLSSRVQVVDTVRCERWGSGAGYLMVVTPYQEDVSLADYLADNPFTLVIDEFVEIATTIIQTTSSIDPPRQGYGPYKVGRALHESPYDYYSSHVVDFVSRVGAACPGSSSRWRRFGDELIETIEKYLASGPAYGLVPVDVNFKNFLVGRAGGLILINIPIFVFGPIAHGLASFAFQARGHNMADMVSSGLCARFTGIDPSELSVFECYNALGVLAFCARDGGESMMKEPMWGSNVKLVDVVHATAREAGLAGL